MALAGRLAAMVRAADPDRYFSALFAPVEVRPLLFALYAFNHEMARVAETTHEPMLSAIRREWWRETVESAAAGKPRDHDVARGLALLFAARPLALSAFEALIAARALDDADERFADFAALESYIAATGGALVRLAAAVLGVGAPGVDGPEMDEAALAYGLAGLLRSLPHHRARNKLYLPLDLLSAQGLSVEAFFASPEDARAAEAVRHTVLRAKAHFLAARRGPKPGAALPALLPAALVPLYLKRPARAVAIPRRQMALLAAALRGRL